MGGRTSLILVSGRLEQIRITNSALPYFKTVLLAGNIKQLPTPENKAGAKY